MDFINVNGAVISKVPQDDELDMNEINNIVEHTKNTWQSNRSKEEALQDTIQGKKAEIVFEKFISKASKSRFIAYDKFRKDNYKKHAPFDGIMVEKSVPHEVVICYLDKINNEILNGSTDGKITTELRKELENNKIFTIEIKSSSLKERDYQGVDQYGERNLTTYQKIVCNILKWDFFVYPHYLRKSDNIDNFFDYSEYVKNEYSTDFSNLGNEMFLKKLIEIEYENASDIYTRMYFDYLSNEIYIPGYILKEDFFEKPYINKMPGKKSGKALYYMHSIFDNMSFYEIDMDNRIWNYNRIATYNKLFAGQQKKCPICDESLRICRGTERKNFYYKCFKCNKNYQI